MKAELSTLLHLGTHVNLRSRVLPYQDDGETGRDTARLEFGDFLSALGEDLCGHFFSINDCRHDLLGGRLFLRAESFRDSAARLRIHLHQAYGKSQAVPEK